MLTPPTLRKVLLKRGAAACPSIFGSGWIRELQALGRTPSVLERASAVEAAFRSDCLVEGSTRALIKRRAFLHQCSSAARSTRRDVTSRPLYRIAKDSHSSAAPSVCFGAQVRKPQVKKEGGEVVRVGSY